MLKRILFICSAFMFFAVTSNAQIFTIGPKVGVSNTSMKLSDAVNEYESGDAKYSYHAGAFARITIASFYVQPELYFNSVKGEYVSTDGTGQTYEFNKNKVDLPVLFGWKLGPLRLNAGPVASFNTNTDIDSNQPVEQYKSAIFAYQAGVGLDISKITLDLRYEGNFSDQGSVGNGEFKVNQLLFSLGFKLL
ncbi:porin family protein [Marivirga atlantica]|jgi:hypothetical protein|uniref:PorT family protein n=1 Tax=Marivirga atlantica TaxID=1548457 RepID=A0A937AE14_9BACT|nr:porin family protein [Marivirga atlantica]MBL0764986.1 PorT family protein [Marivirga atlantica]